MRISTTTIESFRLFMEPDQEWMTEEDLLATIRGEFKTTEAIELGMAFERILEAPDKYHVAGGYSCRGFHFAESVMVDPLSVIDRRGVWQPKAVKRYGDCDVVAKADLIVGASLHEIKTTGSSFDFDKYAHSCQWRFMVDIFEPQDVTYHVFVVNDHGNGVVEIRSRETFRLYPYAALHQDCCDLVEAFKSYVTAKGLDGLLRQRQAEAATWAA